MAFRARACQSFACVFWRASEKNRLNCSSERFLLLSHGERPLLLLLLLLLLMCGISADFCPSLACLSICLQVKLCISQAADRRPAEAANGRTDVETPRHLHRIISYCCVIAIPVPLLPHTHGDKRIPIPKSYPLQYQLQYPQQPRLLVTFFSFFMIDVSARRMQRSTKKQRTQVHWAKIMGNK